MSRKNVQVFCGIAVIMMLAGVCMLVYERYGMRTEPGGGEGAELDAGMEEAERIAGLYRDIYEQAVRTDTLDSIEVMRRIVERLGEYGYTAVDADNQVDMANPKNAEHFIKQQEAGEEGGLTVVRFLQPSGFTIYDMRTEEGRVSITRGFYEYVDGRLKNGSMDRYDADFWEYTAEGYLLFEGELFSEEQYVMELGEMTEHITMRVKPLGEECRSFNRAYILPVGYGRNNLFLLDWNEEDFGEIDFQDLFDILYPLVYGRKNPYGEQGIGTGQISHVPEKEFEHVIQSYFDIESGELQKKTLYFAEDSSYGFRTREMSELEFPEIPYPEVVSYVENADGTITLTVNAVYPDRNCARAYSHEVTVRPLTGGGVRYVSNRVITAKEQEPGSWHRERQAEPDPARAGLNEKRGEIR